MALTLQEMSDRFELMDLLTAYSVAIDKKDLNTLDRIFSPDALLDFSRAGGPCADLPTIKEFLQENLEDLPRQHILSNFQFHLKSDLADVRVLCHNPLELPPNGQEVMIWGLWYEDICIRTKDGWKIQKKVTMPSYHWKLRQIL